MTSTASCWQVLHNYSPFCVMQNSLSFLKNIISELLSHARTHALTRDIRLSNVHTVHVELFNAAAVINLVYKIHAHFCLPFRALLNDVSESEHLVRTSSSFSESFLTSCLLLSRLT